MLLTKLNYSIIRVATVFFVFLLLVNPIAISHGSSITLSTVSLDQPGNCPIKNTSVRWNEDDNVKVINIAQYPRYAGCDNLFDIIFNYQWESNGTIYSFNLTELTLDGISGKGEKPLKVGNFDLLFTGATFDSFYKHGSDKELLNNIKNFVSNGGGYQSVCAGTVFSTQGYENPDKIYRKYVNNHVLKIANVYLNLNWFGEAQYVFKMGAKSGGLVPMEDKVVKNSSNPIFKDYLKETINISYGGGPGLYPAGIEDPMYGNITPLLVINEELMETKPIHWYRKGILPGWIPFKKVETDLKGQYSAIASTYGDGRIVIFNCHPEITLVVNGTIDDYIGKPSGYGFGKITIPPFRVVFSWNGTPMNMSRNFWIHRRAAAWIAGVPDEDLPPCNQLMVSMDKPQFRLRHRFYFKDSLVGSYFNFSLLGPYFNFPWIEKSPLVGRLMGRLVSKRFSRVVSQAGMTVIVGDITVEAYAENSDVVEFYLDEALKYIDYERPFEWKLDKKLSGVHRLNVRAYDEYGSCVCDGSEFLFYNP